MRRRRRRRAGSAGPGTGRHDTHSALPRVPRPCGCSGGSAGSRTSGTVVIAAPEATRAQLASHPARRTVRAVCPAFPATPGGGRRAWRATNRALVGELADVDGPAPRTVSRANGDPQIPSARSRRPAADHAGRAGEDAARREQHRSSVPAAAHGRARRWCPSAHRDVEHSAEAASAPWGRCRRGAANAPSRIRLGAMRPSSSSGGRARSAPGRQTSSRRAGAHRSPAGVIRGRSRASTHEQPRPGVWPSSAPACAGDAEPACAPSCRAAVNEPRCATRARSRGRPTRVEHEPVGMLELQEQSLRHQRDQSSWISAACPRGIDRRDARRHPHARDARWPDQGAGPWPVAVVLGELFGPTDVQRDAAERVAALGHVAIGAALLHRRAPGERLTEDEPAAHAAWPLASLAPPRTCSDVRDALNWALRHRRPTPRAAPVAVGLSFGGHVAVLAALATELRPASRCTPLAGRPAIAPSATPQAACRCTGPLLLLVGDADPLVPSSDLDALRRWHPDADVVTYRGVGHRFASTGRPGRDADAA